VESLFGLPTEDLALALGACWVVVAVALVWSGLRSPVLARLALRHIPRRRAQTALVTLGLMLSTTIVTTALGTGDTMSHAIRTVVTSSLGRADEIIVPSEAYGWGEGRAALQGLRRGDAVAAATRSPFPYSEYERIAGGARGMTTVAAMAPAVVELRTVVNTSSRLAIPDVKVLGVPASYDSTFGPITGPRGPVRLDELKPGEVYLNAEAAGALMATAGSRIEITSGETWNPSPWRARIREVVRAPGLAGSQATVLMPLEHLWDGEGGWERGSINAVLIANPGDAESSVDLSRDATRDLRNLIADKQVAAQLYALMAAPEFRGELGKFVQRSESKMLVEDEEELHLLQGLQKELDRGRLTPEFISLMGDPELIDALGEFAYQAWNVPSLQEASDLLGRLHPLSVREVKRTGLERADLVGSVLTSVFVVLGLFSIAVGTMLVFLIWVMLAAERRSEMGTARAVGFKRRHLVQMFLFEGAVYSAISSAAGVLAGLLVGRLAVGLLADIVRPFGVEIEPYFAPRSLVIAFCLGGLLTFSVVAYCSWRISRLSIVAAIRDLPESTRAPARAGLRGLLTSSPVRASALAILALASLLSALRWEQVGLWGLGISLLAVGGAVALRAGLARTGARWADRAIWSLAGVALVAYWSRPLEEIGRARDFPVRGHVEVFVLAGVLMVLGAVWVIVYNLSTVLRALELALGRLPRAAAVLRTAVAYPLGARFRTGTVLAMFALVIFTMVVGSVLTRTTGAAYTDVQTMTGGFQLAATSSEPIPDLNSALRTAPAIRPETFAAAGSSAQLDIESLRLDLPVSRWSESTLTVVDGGWLRGAGYRLAARAPSFSSDGDVWRALRERPDLALAVPGTDPERSVFRLGVPFKPVPVWLRDTRGGSALQLTVVGLLDPRAALGEGLLTSSRNVEGRLPRFDWQEYAFKLAPGEDARRAAIGLELSFTQQQLRVDLSGEQALRREAIRILLNYLLTGFMGLGLVVGIAALGVIATRAVVERRRQIATLRAIGFRAGSVQLGLILEASVVAALGILLGVGLGLVVSRNIVSSFALEYPEMLYVVPWRQVAVLSLSAWACVLLTTVLPAWQAARIPPAAGLRTE
jgi:putative ABC transport system permease protein